MNLTTTVARTTANKRKSARLRHASSLLGGALIGTSIMAPILAGGDTVEGDAFVIFFSGLLAVLGIVMHVAGSGGTAHAVPMTASVPTSDPDYSRCATQARTRV
jgi:hypothetical protein